MHAPERRECLCSAECNIVEYLPLRIGTYMAENGGVESRQPAF